VRAVCAATGFLGTPIDPVFEDRELFADYLTDYYLDREPEATWVCELDGEICGYLLGCCRPLLHQTLQAIDNLSVAIRGAYRCYRWPYNRASRDFLRWIVANAWREVPAAPRLTPHFHINLLPEARRRVYAQALIEAFLELLHRRGRRRVYGQMVTYESRRTEALFARYGFKLVSRAEITKYRRFYPGRVFLSTVVRDLSDGPALVGRSRRRGESQRTT
jgi:GNAT superfamily N-acetyltransferase